MSTGHLLYAQYFKCKEKSGKYLDDGSCSPFVFLFKAKEEVGHYLYTIYIFKIYFWIMHKLIIKINILFKGFSEIFKSSFRWNSFLKLVHESFCLERNKQLSMSGKYSCGLTRWVSYREILTSLPHWQVRIPVSDCCDVRCLSKNRHGVLWLNWCLKKKKVERRKWLYRSSSQKEENV